jgi:flavin reductase (DIM6/NTAB) family NADH-FMN oxidoreductase RutF
MSSEHTLPSAEVDTRLLRHAFGTFATGVTVVTTTAPDGQPVGLTANSFTSVSLDPPLVLFCLDRRSANLGVFEQGAGFAIHVLHSHQQDLSGRFVSKTGERFAGTRWEMRPDLQVPVIEGTAARFECRKHAVFDGGDHLIFVGRVQRFDFHPECEPLLYFQGRYRGMAAAADPALAA